MPLVCSTFNIKKTSNAISSDVYCKGLRPVSLSSYTIHMITVEEVLYVIKCLISPLLQLSTFRWHFLKHIYSPSKYSSHFKLFETVYFTYYLPDGNALACLVCVCNFAMWCRTLWWQYKCICRITAPLFCFIVDTPDIGIT